MEPLDIVKQTGKTIIFEEFNRDEEKMNLVTLLTRDDEEIPLEQFAQTLMGKDSELVVKNFAEFIEKFSPTVYETVVTTEDGSSRFVYTLDKPGYKCTEIKLKDHAFYKMIMNLIDRKANSDKGNFEFPYDDLKKALSPESEMEECRKIRRNLYSNTKEYYKLTDGGKKPNLEADRFVKNIVACRKKAIEKYQRSPLALLPLLIADKQAQLEAIKAAETPQGESGGTKAIPCEYAFDDQGKLKLIELKVSDDAPAEAPQEGSNTQLVEVVRKDFEKNAPAKIQKNNYIANMVVNVFVPSGGAQLSTQDKGELEAEKKELQDIYKASLESFAKAVAATVEKFAGVKSFFDHASFDGELPQDVSVIIANCKVDAIVNDTDPKGAKERFKKYFGDLSNEKDVNRIWFGVIPAISTGEEGQSTAEEVSNPFDDLPSEDPAEKKDPAGLVGLEAAKEMLALLTEAKIMTFVNYKAGESTGFIGLSASKINQYRKDFESVNSEYAVFVYPNFTILPKEKGVAQIGTEYNAEFDEEVGAYIAVPGVYLDAAYVACGMTVGVQNYKFLKKKKYNVNPKYPCVRFDLEDPENSKRVTTKLNRETTTEMRKQIQDAIMEDRFGFVFADNKVVFDGKVLNNTYVLNARTLQREGNGKYKALYKTLVKNLVSQILRALANSEYVPPKVIEQFKKEYAETWKQDNKFSTKQYANRILRENESIDRSDDNKKLVVLFDKEEDPVEVEIEDSVTNGEGKK